MLKRNEEGRKRHGAQTELSVAELEALLRQKQQQRQQQRRQRLQREGRVVEVDGRPVPPPLPRATAVPSGRLRDYVLTLGDEETRERGGAKAGETAAAPTPRWRQLLNKGLLLVEITAVIGLIVVLTSLWSKQQELNQELSQVQQAEVQSVALPTPEPTPVIDVAILPTGHRFVEGRPPEPIESADIPTHLLPIINAYEPPPLPTPGPEQARRVQIPAIGVDSTIVQDAYDWEQLKKGVGHHIGSAQPGQIGNMVLAAHNDVFGEIFRDLDKLSPGDQILVSTERQTYTYVVNRIEVVDPVEGTWVMAATDYASATLISCYPYRINTQRIVVFADLADNTALQ